MGSPYGAPLSNNAGNSGGSMPQQPPQPRPPVPPQGGPVWGPGQTPPPFGSPDGRSSNLTIPPAPSTRDWGNTSAGFAPPPQFSYNPDQPLMTPPPSVPPPKKSRKRLVIAVSSAVVVAAAAVTGGVILMSHDDSDKPAVTGGPLTTDTHTSDAPRPPSADPVWKAEANTDPNAKTTLGSWLTDSNSVIRGDTTGLQSYDIKTGKELWTFAPNQGETLCEMSRVARSKVGVLRYGQNGNCTSVAAIDTGSGKPLWTATIPGGGPDNSSISLTDGLVSGTGGNLLTVWNAADGKKLWDADLAKANPTCRLIQAAVRGTSAAVLADCGKGATVLMKDGHTGADQWQTPLPPAPAPDAHYTLVQAASPAVVHIEATQQGSTPADQYVALSDKGQIQSTFNGTGPFGQLEPRLGPEGKQAQVAHMQGNILVEPTTATDPATGKPSASGLVAIDTATGKQLWQSPAMNGSPVAIVALDPDTTVVLDGGNTKAGPGARLLAFSTMSGTAKTSPIPDPLGPDWAGTSAAYLVGDRLVVVPAQPTKGASMVAFEVKQ
ncbi:PQQ-binding-like beta-propeller repeat protein [Catenulispora subtropica]|uniref:Pyrrolo-quinoline quinone repeat domain-containing protein n=1 Tax=Catenulispora subtropica TaxID=450798 RepID=A0ABN2S984_9ACTN